MKTKENQTRDDKLDQALSSLAADVIRSHAVRAEGIALESCSDEKAKARMSLALEWDAGSHSPRITARVSYAVRYKDEFEVQEHFDQTTLKFEKKLI